MKTVLLSALVSALVAAGVVVAYHFSYGAGGAGAGLEKEFHDFRAEVRSTSTAPKPSPLPAVSGDEVAKFRALQAEVRTIEMHERDLDTVRRILQSTGVKLAKDLEDKVCELGAGLLAKFKAASAVQSAAPTPEERSAAQQKSETAVSEFEADLRALVLPEEAAKILEKFPGRRFAPHPLPVPGPTPPPPAMGK